MNKLIFVFFLIFSAWFISCSDEKSDPCDKCTAEQYCRLETCFNYSCSAEHPNGSCKTGQHCESGECVIEQCSAEYPKGVCQSSSQECKDGVCQDYECSRAHPTGVCPQGQACLSNFQCGEITCSASNTNGECQNGYECSSDGTCVQQPCSASNPFGSCQDSNYECVDGDCLSKDRCSANNPDGLCSLHQRCEEGVCKDISCSESNPDGACPSGQYCNHEHLEAGEYITACDDIPTSCTDTNECPQGYKCDSATNKCVEYVCEPSCQEKEICLYGNCQPDPFFCGIDYPNGWCEDGYRCIDGSCQVPVNNPCDGVDCGNNFCIVTDWNSDTGYECVAEGDLCSDSNTTGRCNAPQVCQGGVCSDANPCDNVTCGETEVCNSYTGVCIENYCKSHPNSCVEEHTICVNMFTGDDLFRCPCDIGYEYVFEEGKCIQNFTACTNKDCGEGICTEDIWADEGWKCICDTGMEVLDNTEHLCIDPATYDYCTNWDCGVGSCEEILNDDGSKEAVCDCPENFIFDSIQKTCVPGIVCGNTICNNPLREECVNNTFCEAQPCNSNYPQGTCGNAETCIEGSCVLTEECSELTSAGYCMDGYSCKTGICCKGGNCTTEDNTLKLVGQTCDLDTNNCVNDAICVPTPTGDGVCHKLCDQTRIDSCDSLNVGDTIYHCVGRNVFNGVDYDKIGVCAVDNNCSKTDNSGCLTNQVCLGFRRTNFTQCFAYEETIPLGASCTTGTTALGFNVGCAENYLCVDNTCVPNCDNAYKISDNDVNLCYDPFTENYKVENLKVKDQGELTFNSQKKHTEIAACDPNNDNCGNGLSCVKIQDKDSSSGVSKDVGLCALSCDFNSATYKDECGGTDICFQSNGNSICLGDSNCDPVLSTGCAGDEVCYPITSNLSSCMTTSGFGHPGEACTGACQYGMCINGFCDYPCNIGDNSSCNANNGETCSVTTDSYINNVSHFGSPSTYGVCQ
jgi:hypothetical protein